MTNSRNPTLDADANWWRQASVYQIYPRSFADSNGDGIGDLRGIADKLPYLAELGIDAIWLSPFYPSALADGGYDVDDYRDVDPSIGTLADFDELAAAVHSAGIRIIVDIVPNHTSNRHEWFLEAVASPRGSAARARYIFRDGIGDLPPNDWTSLFGGSAWERITEPDGTPGQWYLHLFAKEQPDLDWDNPEVHEDFLRTLRFWSDRGVDGFRVDVAHALKKDMDAAQNGDWTTDPDEIFIHGEHPLWDRDAVHSIYAEWRKVFDEYDPPRMAVAEVWVPPHRVSRYASPDGLGQAFNFDLLKADFDAGQFRKVIENNLTFAADSGASSTWVFSNHDVVRHATRYGLPKGTGSRNEKGTDGIDWLFAGGDPAEVDAELGLRRATSASLLMFALPGSAYLYQGEEIGLPEVGQIPDVDRQDPIFYRNGSEVGRDGCRVPIPWETSGPSFGFGSAGAHLPQPTWFSGYAVEAQNADAGSTLSLYRQALTLRRELRSEESLEWLESEEEVLHFVRPGGWHVVANFGTAPIELPDGDVLLSSVPVSGGKLPGEATAWVRSSR
nr:alpha-amylase family glycosyl hydrolase [Rhodococcus sp. (in: high G+C Gram-positive bacteria)]